MKICRRQVARTFNLHNPAICGAAAAATVAGEIDNSCLCFLLLLNCNFSSNFSPSTVYRGYCQYIFISSRTSTIIGQETRGLSLNHSLLERHRGTLYSLLPVAAQRTPKAICALDATIPRPFPSFMQRALGDVVSASRYRNVHYLNPCWGPRSKQIDWA